MEDRSEELPQTDDMPADPAGDAPAASEGDEGGEGWDGVADVADEDLGDENLEGESQADIEGA